MNIKRIKILSIGLVFSLLSINQVQATGNIPPNNPELMSVAEDDDPDAIIVVKPNINLAESNEPHQGGFPHNWVASDNEKKQLKERQKNFSDFVKQAKTIQNNTAKNSNAGLDSLPDPLKIAERLQQSGSFGSGPLSEIKSQGKSIKNPKINDTNIISVDEAISQRYLAVGWVGCNNTCGEYEEPNLYQYRNYCGPSSAQVALRARISQTSVPSLWQVGQDMGVDPTWGVNGSQVTNYLNTKLNTNFYVNVTPSSASQLWWYIVDDINNGWIPVFSLRTYSASNGYMVGWASNPFHIISADGYYTTGASNQSPYIIDTASSVAGYNGPYAKYINVNALWSYTSQNNWMAW